MKTISIVAIVLLTSAGCSKRPKNSEDNYVITAHTVTENGSENDYTVTYGKVVLKVRYAESQTSSAKPGDTPGSGLHPHSAGGTYPANADLSQIPLLGTPIRRCLLSKDVMHDGSPIIAVQPTPVPCIYNNGQTLQYLPEPNGPSLFTYVSFEIISERVRD
jgi:hypothetical protein